MNFLDEEVSGYLRKLCDRYDEPVLIEMEKRAEERGFPIVGRVVGASLELLARSIGARRVFELGSGYGFSGYWFARAVGAEGEVILTDGDADNAELAKDFLGRAGVWDRCKFMVGDAVDSLAETDGQFDAVYCDIDKGDYPRAFDVAKSKLRKGGLYMCDNVLWSGRVARDDDDAWTEAIRKHNKVIYEDPDFMSMIIPVRDGVMVALKLI
ncbi:MAG: O-methyltransferase [Actinomycetota bacterium]